MYIRTYNVKMYSYVGTSTFVFVYCEESVMLILLMSTGAIAVSSGVFGDNITSTVLHDVVCYGNETSVLDCFHATSDPGTCLEHSAAVICQGRKVWEVYIHTNYYQLLTYIPTLNTTIMILCCSSIMLKVCCTLYIIICHVKCTYYHHTYVC